ARRRGRDRRVSLLPNWSYWPSRLLEPSPESPASRQVRSLPRRHHMTDTTAPRFVYGAHSEVGRLRKVLVCAPGLAHNRLTPSNCDDLLFDDVLCVQRAQRDHFDFGTACIALGREKTGVREYLMPPLPNTLYTRDTTCWIYGGVTLNPLYWPARHDETLLMKAVYAFHPDFADTGINVWWGDPERD